jgi:hypothetical protein
MSKILPANRSKLSVVFHKTARNFQNGVAGASVGGKRIVPQAEEQARRRRIVDDMR